MNTTTIKKYLSRITGTLALILGVAGLVLTGPTGCHTTRLEQGGAYALTNTVPDMQFFVVESTYDIAYSSVLAVMKFERDNRLMLWNISPQIKHTLDGIRPKVVEADKAYVAARASYILNPTPVGLTPLNESLQKMQQLLATAQAVIPKGK